MRDKASATELLAPLMCRMSAVNFEMKSRCHTCLGERRVPRDERARVSEDSEF